MTAPEPQPRYWGTTRRVTLQRAPRYGAAVYAYVLVDGGVVGWVWKSAHTDNWFSCCPDDDVAVDAELADDLDDAVTRVLTRTRPELVET